MRQTANYATFPRFAMTGRVRTMTASYPHGDTSEVLRVVQLETSTPAAMPRFLLGDMKPMRGSAPRGPFNGDRTYQGFRQSRKRGDIDFLRFCLVDASRLSNPVWKQNSLLLEGCVIGLQAWVLLTVSVGLQAGAKLASGLAGLEKQPDATTANTILSALLITIMLDLSIRAALSSISNRRWRELYLTLARLAIANIFLGAVALMLIAGPG
jgi:hypothetical protein